MTKKQVLRFSLKLISILLCVSLVLIAANFLYVKGAYYTDVYGEVEAMENVPDSLKLVNVGTSHGLACFRYDENKKEYYNLALSGSDIYHNFATVKQFKDKLSDGCIIAIPTSYFSFCMPTDEPSQKRYYTYLDKEYIKDFSYETLINTKILPVLRSGEFVIKDLIKDQEMDVGGAMMGELVITYEPALAAPSSVNADIPEYDEQKHLELVSHAKGRATSWISGYFETKQRYINENIGILTEFVGWCYENGFRPILVTTPVYYALNDEFSDEQLQKCYYDNIKKVAESSGAPYLDLSHDEKLSSVPGYYGNSDHMNEDGAKAFMDVFFNYLKEIGYDI